MLIFQNCAHLVDNIQLFVHSVRKCDQPANSKLHDLYRIGIPIRDVIVS